MLPAAGGVVSLPLPVLQATSIESTEMSAKRLAIIFTNFIVGKSSDFFYDIHVIVYTIRRIKSRFYFEYITGPVDAAEYENAAEKLEFPYTAGIVEVNGTVQNQGYNYFNYGETPEQLNDYIGKTYYYYSADYRSYQKIIYTALHLSYLNLTFINDDTFEVSYYDNSLKCTQTLRIKTDSYTVVYFNTAE